MESPLSPPMTSLTRAIQLAPARSPPRAIHFIFESIHYVVRKVNNRAVSSLSCDPTQPSPASQYSPALRRCPGILQRRRLLRRRPHPFQDLLESSEHHLVEVLRSQHIYVVAKGLRLR